MVLLPDAFTGILVPLHQKADKTEDKYWNLTVEEVPDLGDSEPASLPDACGNQWVFHIVALVSCLQQQLEA